MQCCKCKAEIQEDAVFCPFCGKKQAPAPRKRRKRANGSGNISKLTGNRRKPWVARRNGVTVGTYSTYSEAQKALDRLADANVTEKFNLTFSQVYDLWKPEHFREISPSQQGCYEASYKRCAPLHGLQFRKLRTSDFQRIITQMEEAGKAKSTCQKTVQLFSQLSKWAMQEEIIATNYAQFVSIRAQQKTQRTAFSPEQIEAIRKSDHTAAPIALILLGSGCRPVELFSVPLADCHDTYFIGGSKTQAGRGRVIAVSPMGLAAYQILLAKARQNGCEKLIHAYSGNRTVANFSKRDFSELMAGIGCTGMTTYNCRHTFATLAVKNGVDPALLKRIMGHADISTTDKFYTHLDTEDILKAISAVKTAPPQPQNGTQSQPFSAKSS